MIEIDAVTFTILIILVVVVTTILVDTIHRRCRLDGRREGEEVGKLRERALWWERTARAADRVAVISVARPPEVAEEDWPHKID